MLPELRAEDVLLAGIPAVVITVLLAVGIRWGVARSAAIGAAIVAISAQATVATAFYWPTAERSAFYPSSDGIRYIQQNVGHDRIAGSGFAIRPNINQMFGLRSIMAHTFYPEQMKDLLEKIYPDVLIGPTYAQLLTVPDLWVGADGLDRLGVRYLIGDDNAPYPGTRDFPVPIPGDLDPLAQLDAQRALTAGRTYSTTIASGPLRGVSIPLTLRSESDVSVALKDHDGRLITENSVRTRPGSWNVPVPLAAEPEGMPPVTDSESHMTVEVSVDQPNVFGSFDANGDIRIQPVRSPQEPDNARLAFAGDDLVIWERLGALPRIRWADDVTVIKDDGIRSGGGSQRHDRRGRRDPFGPTGTTDCRHGLFAEPVRGCARHR